MRNLVLNIPLLPLVSWPLSINWVKYHVHGPCPDQFQERFPSKLFFTSPKDFPTDQQRYCPDWNIYVFFITKYLPPWRLPIRPHWFKSQPALWSPLENPPSDTENAVIQIPVTLPRDAEGFMNKIQRGWKQADNVILRSVLWDIDQRFWRYEEGRVAEGRYCTRSIAINPSYHLC